MGLMVVQLPPFLIQYSRYLSENYGSIIEEKFDNGYLDEEDAERLSIKLAQWFDNAVAKSQRGELSEEDFAWL